MKFAERPFKGYQGEGPSMGRPALFIRMLSCNLSCDICDTKFSWRLSELESVDCSEELLFEQIQNSNRIVFTGGEPLLKKNIKMMNQLTDFFSYPMDYEIETNGTLIPDEDFLDRINHVGVQLNISPKFNVVQQKDVDTTPILVDYITDNELDNLKQNMIVKILFNGPDDIEMALSFIKDRDININQLWMQPCGISSEQLKKTIKRYEQILLDNSINLSFRTHVFIHENLKGC